MQLIAPAPYNMLSTLDEKGKFSSARAALSQRRSEFTLVYKPGINIWQQRKASQFVRKKEFGIRNETECEGQSSPELIWTLTTLR